MNNKTLALSKKTVPRNVASVRTIFPASRSSSSYTDSLPYQSRSVGFGRNTVRKSIGQLNPGKSTSHLPTRCGHHPPLPILSPSKTTNLKRDQSGMTENVEDKNERESIEEGELIPDKSPDAWIKSSMNAHDVIWHGNEKNCVLQGQSPFDGSKTRDSLPEKCLLTRRDFPPGCGSGARVKDLVGDFVPSKSCDPSIKSSATAHVFKWCRNKDYADDQGVDAKEGGSQSQVKFQTSSRGTVDKEYLRKENFQTSSRGTADKEYLRKEKFLYHHRDFIKKSDRNTQIITREVQKSVQCSASASAMMKDKGFKRKSHDRCNIGNRLEENTPGGSSESLDVHTKSDIGRASPSFSKVRNVNFTHNRHGSARDRVHTTLRLYRDICRKLSREKSRVGKESMCIRRIDFHAAKEVKKRAGYVHGTMQFIGDVPGVKVGDKFYYRMELAVVGLHRPSQSGIDYLGTHPDILATSVVASWDYMDDLSQPDELVYLGQGGMPGHDKKAEDQKLTRGNLALLNSMRKKTPVRVIRKDRNHIFTYDGLYVVVSCRELRRANRQMVFKFLMRRLPGQPEIGQKKKKMKRLESS